jgi:putative hydrolase of the HAD superfamily
MRSRTKVLLFDICGVLFDVSGGVDCMLKWLKWSINEKQLLQKWISSFPVRQFELGKIELEVFAQEVIKEFTFPVNKKQFINEYISWHKGPYDGAIKLIKDLSKVYITASFSNINELQWSEINKSGLLGYMNFNFASYEIGFLKPEKEAFEYVINKLQCDASEILFFYDNIVNVEAAKIMNIQSYQTRGIRELREKIVDLLKWEQNKG